MTVGPSMPVMTLSTMTAPGRSRNAVRSPSSPLEAMATR